MVSASVRRQTVNREATLRVFANCTAFSLGLPVGTPTHRSPRAQMDISTLRHNCYCQSPKLLALQLRTSLLFRSGSLEFHRGEILTAFWVTETTYFVGAPALKFFRTGKKAHPLNCAHRETVRELTASITLSFLAHSPQPAQHATSRKPAEHGATCSHQTKVQYVSSFRSTAIHSSGTRHRGSTWHRDHRLCKGSIWSEYPGACKRQFRRAAHFARPNSSDRGSR